MSAPPPETTDLKWPKGSDYFPCPNFLIINPARDYQRLHVWSFILCQSKKPTSRDTTLALKVCLLKIATNLFEYLCTRALHGSQYAKHHCEWVNEWVNKGSIKQMTWQERMNTNWHNNANKWRDVYSDKWLCCIASPGSWSPPPALCLQLPKGHRGQRSQVIEMSKLLFGEWVIAKMLYGFYVSLYVYIYGAGRLREVKRTLVY